MRYFTFTWFELSIIWWNVKCLSSITAFLVNGWFFYSNQLAATANFKTIQFRVVSTGSFLQFRQQSVINFINLSMSLKLNSLWKTIIECQTKSTRLNLPHSHRHRFRRSTAQAVQTWKKSRVSINVTDQDLLEDRDTVWGGRLCKSFWNMFSGSPPCLLGQHGSCSSAQLPVELSENMLQNLFHNLLPQTVQ